jgi:tRNA-binding EMAP/Myf-like protein
MSVIIMEVLETNPHPNADALRVYRFSAGAQHGEPLQIVANLSSVYAVGDRVAIATVGSELKDGTKIRPARLRGVDSFGMALGVHAAPLGSDVSAEFCAPRAVAATIEPGATSVPGTAPSAPSDTEAVLVSWPSIELLHHVRAGARTAAEVDQRSPPRVRYRAKVKLDGTNAGVQIWPDGRVVPQSRSQVLHGGADNLGFAKWVREHQAYFAALRRADVLVLFGEWCGQGIQKRAAIAQIDRKIFAVFAAQTGLGNTKAARVQAEPERLRALLPDHRDVFVLPWLSPAFELDFADDAQLEQQAEAISDWVDRIEAADPWVAEAFGVQGIGEGMVLYPQVDGADSHDGDSQNGDSQNGDNGNRHDHDGIDRQFLSEWMFKAKGEKHQAVRQKRAAQIQPEVAKGVDEFSELVLTEPRLEQGVQEACQGQLEMSRMGAFLKWISEDVRKECSVELEAAGLEWSQVGRALSTRARTWFMRRVAVG